MRMVRRALVLLMLVATLNLSGCMVNDSTTGDVTTFRNHWTGALLVAAIGLTPLIIGGGMLSEALRTARPRKKPRKGSPGVLRNPNVSRIFLGGAFLIAGVLILLLGVPTTLVSYIAVGPDKVVIRDSALWFLRGAREIPYSSIHGINVQEEQVMSRRGRRTKYILHLTTSQGHERTEMSALHKAAVPKLQERFAAWQSSGAASIAQNAVPPSIGDISAVTSPDAGLDSQPATGAASPAPAGRAPAESLLHGNDLADPAVGGAANARQPSGPRMFRPGGANEGPRVTDDAVVTPGMRLTKLYAGQWRPVDVLAVEPGGRIKIHWVGYTDAWDEVVPRSELRFPADGSMNPMPSTGGAAPAGVASAERPGAPPGEAVPNGPGHPWPADLPFDAFAIQPVRIWVKGTWKSGHLTAESTAESASVKLPGVDDPVIAPRHHVRTMLPPDALRRRLENKRP